MSNLLRQSFSARAPSNLEKDEQEDQLGSLSGPQRPNRKGVQSKVRPWHDYFEEQFKVQCGDQKEFNVYYSPPSEVNAPLFIFHHGIASSGLSFAVTAQAIRSKMSAQLAANPVAKEQYIAGTISFDMRGHGTTTIRGNDHNNFSLDTMVDDFITMCQKVIEVKHLDKNPIIMVGHSMGGAVVSKAAVTKRLKNVVGLCVLDAVEEPALEALNAMDLVLASWPKRFDSIERSVDWHLQSNTLRNRESAEVSVQGMLRQNVDTGDWVWTQDPKLTEPYWRDWFIGLSKTFLAAPAARLLILAGTDRLDKELIIGQMQGKYQLVVFAESGHYIQEDEPKKTAITLIDFWERNGRPADIIPKFGKFRALGE